jgi:hypothetical protein
LVAGFRMKDFKGNENIKEELGITGVSPIIIEYQKK